MLRQHRRVSILGSGLHCISASDNQNICYTCDSGLYDLWSSLGHRNIIQHVCVYARTWVCRHTHTVMHIILRVFVPLCVHACVRVCMHMHIHLCLTWKQISHIFNWEFYNNWHNASSHIFNIEHDTCQCTIRAFIASIIGSLWETNSNRRKLNK